MNIIIVMYNNIIIDRLKMYEINRIFNIQTSFVNPMNYFQTLYPVNFDRGFRYTLLENTPVQCIPQHDEK